MIRYLAGLLERTGMTALQAFIAALLLAGVYNLDVVASAAFAGVAAALTVIIAALHTYLTGRWHFTNLWVDLAVRTAATWLAAFLAGLSVGGTLDLSAAASAATAALTAALAFLKSALATRIGNPATASVLPLRLDPGTGRHAAPEQAAA